RSRRRRDRGQRPAVRPRRQQAVDGAFPGDLRRDGRLHPARRHPGAGAGDTRRSGPAVLTALRRAGWPTASPWRRHLAKGYGLDDGSGTFELKMSIAISHEPSACFLEITTYLPLSLACCPLAVEANAKE